MVGGEVVGLSMIPVEEWPEWRTLDARDGIFSRFRFRSTVANLDPSSSL